MTFSKSSSIRHALFGCSFVLALVACGDDTTEDPTEDGGQTSSSSSGGGSSSSGSSSGQAPDGGSDAGVPDASPGDSGIASIRIGYDEFCDMCGVFQVHQSRQLIAEALDADGLVIEGAAFTWSVSDASKLSLSDSALALGVATGEVDVTAVSGGVSGSVHVTVVPSRAVRIVLTPASTGVAAVGDTVQLQAHGYDYWNYMVDTPASWLVTNPSVGSIDANGIFTGTAQGHTTVLAGIDTAEASAEVTVVSVISATPAFQLDSIAAGASVACGTVGADAYCWGRQFEGNLGNGVPPGNPDGQATPVLVAGNHGFTKFGIGNYHTCAITAAGEAWCWGENGGGSLGQPTDVLQGSPVPVKVSGKIAFTSLVAGLSHTCGISTTGKAYCWGDGSTGALGNGSDAKVSTPTLVDTSATYTQLVAGLWNTCGLRPDGSVDCWGQNSSGALGNGSEEGAIVLSPGAVPGGHHFSQIDSYGSYTCGVELDQTIWCWGRNDLGQTGNGLTETAYLPVQLVSAAHFTKVSTGAFHTCAITTGGETQCVGLGFYGALGNATTQDSLSTVNVVGGLRFVDLDSGSHYICGRLESKATYCWGTGDDGQLGNGYAGPGSFSTVPSPLSSPAP